MNSQAKKQRILVVDDSEMNRSILSDMLGSDFEIIEAGDGKAAISILSQQDQDIALVLLDVIMPVMDGFQVLAVMTKNGWIEHIPVIVLSSDATPNFIERAFDLGATDFIGRPFDTRVVRRRVLNTIMLYDKQKKAVELMSNQIREKEKASNLIIGIFSNMVELRDYVQTTHTMHLRMLTNLLLHRYLQKCPHGKLKYADIRPISAASALHDIGMITVPTQILSKPGPLTQQEFELVKGHCKAGAAILKKNPDYQQEPMLQAAYEICRWHHERYDGKGYPDGLSGDDIPISAQIFALADVYIALTSPRPYRPAHSHDKAIDMILQGACGAFQPLLLDCLADLKERIRTELHADILSRQFTLELHSALEGPAADSGELSASARTLELLEHERTKYQFFASMSGEIQFEYMATSKMLVLSDWGAKYLGLPPLLPSPLDNQDLLSIVSSSDLLEISRLLHTASPENPITEYSCSIRIQGQERRGKLICRTMWSAEEPRKFTGAFGKFVDIHDELNRIDILEKIASRDSLTGLLNHATMRKFVGELLCAHTGRKFALAIVDLDYFKKANDQHGHLFGDNVLKHVAKNLKSAIRASDLAARVGGDEFLIFVECADNMEGQFQRIFNALCDTYDQFPISVSMGVATTEASTSYEDLFSMADRALYAAKRAGRHCFRFYDPTMGETPDQTQK